MFVINSKDEINNELFRQVYDRWISLKTAKQVPLITLLNNNFMMDSAGFTKVVHHESDGRFKYIGVGQAFQKMFKKNIFDEYIDDLYSPWILNNVRKSYLLCIENGRPVYNKKGFTTIIGNIGYEYILFPFTSGKSDQADYMASCLMPFGAKLEDYTDLDKVIKDTPWL